MDAMPEVGIFWRTCDDAYPLGLAAAL
jgi:hypothetical protein